ncbi:MAG: SLC13 family permease [Planctomycetota bacterium]
MKNWILIFGPLLGLILTASLWISGQTPAISWTSGITLWIAFWWIAEPIPIPVTSLIPLALFPLTGVLSPDQIAKAYGSKLILLMLGGFMLSAAMEKSGAHRRIAVTMVGLFGKRSAKGLVFGFMLASAGLSMWISNAATTVMLLPIAMAVIQQIQNKGFATALLLSIAYGASVGGIGTPIGTPPNVIFLEIYQNHTGLDVGFITWMGWTLPIVLIMLPIVGFWLTRNFHSMEPVRIPQIGKWTQAESRTVLVFAFTAFLWMTRVQPFGGWVYLVESIGCPKKFVTDATVGLLGAIALFIVPNGNGDKLLDWKSAEKIPWGVLILFAGGITIAEAFKVSGLSENLGEVLASTGTLPPWLLIGFICLSVTFLTEVTSNTATTTLLMPILLAAAIAGNIDPRIIMIPATISASFAFMLPVATPPNAIVFAADQISVKQMAREGLVLNLIGVAAVTAVCWILFGRL